MRLRPIVGQPGSSSIISRLDDTAFCWWQPLNVEQGRTNGLKVMVGDIRGVFPGSLTGILLDSVCRWHHWFPSRRGTHRRATRTLIPSPTNLLSRHDRMLVVLYYTLIIVLFLFVCNYKMFCIIGFRLYYHKMCIWKYIVHLMQMCGALHCRLVVVGCWHTAHKWRHFAYRSYRLSLCFQALVWKR